MTLLHPTAGGMDALAAQVRKGANERRLLGLVSESTAETGPRNDRGGVFACRRRWDEGLELAFHVVRSKAGWRLFAMEGLAMAWSRHVIVEISDPSCCGNKSVLGGHDVYMAITHCDKLICFRFVRKDDFVCVVGLREIQLTDRMPEQRYSIAYVKLKVWERRKGEESEGSRRRYTSMRLLAEEQFGSRRLTVLNGMKSHILVG